MESYYCYKKQHIVHTCNSAGGVVLICEMDVTMEDVWIIFVFYEMCVYINLHTYNTHTHWDCCSALYDTLTHTTHISHLQLQMAMMCLWTKYLFVDIKQDHLLW